MGRPTWDISLLKRVLRWVKQWSFWIAVPFELGVVSLFSLSGLSPFGRSLFGDRALMIGVCENIKTGMMKSSKLTTQGTSIKNECILFGFPVYQWEPPCCRDEVMLCGVMQSDVMDRYANKHSKARIFGRADFARDKATNHTAKTESNCVTDSLLHTQPC